MIELTIHAADAADLKRQLSELLGGAAPLEPTLDRPAPSPAASEKPSPTRSTKPKAEPEAIPEKVEPEATTATPSNNTETSSDTASAAEPAVDYDAVKAATLALVKAKGRDAAVKVLTAHGAANGATDLKPEQYADYLAAVQEAMA